MNEGDRTVHFGPPHERAWLPPKARLLIDAAHDAGRAKISNRTAPPDRAIWEILQLWADALLGIYSMSIGLSPHDNEMSVAANDPRYALLQPETITKHVSRRVRELVAEYNLAVTPSDLERVTELVSHRTRGWLRSRKAELWGLDIPTLEMLQPPVEQSGTTTRDKKRTKDPQRERLKLRVTELRDGYLKNSKICRNLFICNRLDDDLKAYPSPWKGTTWTAMFKGAKKDRAKVDRYISGLLTAK